MAQVGGAVETSPEGAQIEDEQRIAAAPGEIAPPPREQTNLVRGLRQGVLAGGVSLAMFAPLIGLQTTENIDNQLILKTRWLLLIIIVVA